jgi:hypothetical protein
MDATRTLLQATEGDPVAPFFGFMGAASALVFACESLSRFAVT